jgi:integrase
VGNALRLALLCGVRVSEAAGISRDELEHIEDEARAVWIIDGARTKNGLSHAIPLAPMARTIVLELLGGLARSERFLFPSPTRSGTAIHGASLSNGMLLFGNKLSGDDEAARTWKADPATAHDLRRTFATRMGALGVQKEIRDRLLNHAPAKTDIEGSHYNVHDYLPEKRRALAQWDAALSAILNDRTGSVVSFAQRR